MQADNPATADGDLVALDPDVGQTGDAADVDEHGGHGQPQLHDGQQRVPAGQQLRVLAVLGQRGHGVDQAQAVLIVARTEDAKTGNLKPALFIVPTDSENFSYTMIDMELQNPEKQFQLFLDDVRLPADALVGSEDAALSQLFAGLNPERIMAAASAVGMGRFALDKAVSYVKERTVWKTPIGAHQAIAHPLAQGKVELEMAKLMMQKAATLYDAGDDWGAAEPANMAKYAAAEACVKVVDQAVHSLGGNGLTTEYGLAPMLSLARIARIAPVSREMILNFVAQTSLGLPKSY